MKTLAFVPPLNDSRPTPTVMVSHLNDFHRALADNGLVLRRRQPEVLQINVGKLCNLTCVHCHVNAGPNRKEIISRDTLDRILSWFDQTSIPAVDLTGGSPEMIPDFRYLVTRLRQAQPRRRILDRLNATILMEPGYEDLAEFLADNRVTLFASMPCYAPENVTAQRGEGVFDASIAAFQKLNSLGYARRPDLELHLVYNPNGAFLPAPQADLEADYKREMKRHFDIDFNDLYTITNMPIARFAAYLKRNGHYDDYLLLLKDAFNPVTVEGLMCRHTINVSYTGEVFDCDFNQMLNLHLRAESSSNTPLYLWEIDPETFVELPIRTGTHCFGCTAGAGSSCGGSLV